MSKKPAFKEKDLKDKIDSFTGLLDEINSITDKKKELWKEIFQNALIDRENAYILVQDLMKLVEGDESRHAIHSQGLNKYLERMQAANSQLLRLAELVAEAESGREEVITPNELFEKIRAENTKKSG
jgi:hypothetical protein